MTTTKKTTTKSSAKAKASATAKPKAKPAKPAKQTAEQIADISKASNSFEGAIKIDHLPFEEQQAMVFNPLHTITKTTVGDNFTNSTFIVKPKK